MHQIHRRYMNISIGFGNDGMINDGTRHRFMVSTAGIKSEWKKILGDPTAREIFIIPDVLFQVQHCFVHLPQDQLLRFLHAVFR